MFQKELSSNSNFIYIIYLVMFSIITFFEDAEFCDHIRIASSGPIIAILQHFILRIQKKKKI